MTETPRKDTPFRKTHPAAYDLVLARQRLGFEHFAGMQAM